MEMCVRSRKNKKQDIIVVRVFNEKTSTRQQRCQVGVVGWGQPKAIDAAVAVLKEFEAGKITEVDMLPRRDEILGVAAVDAAPQVKCKRYAAAMEETMKRPAKAISKRPVSDANSSNDLSSSSSSAALWEWPPLAGPTSRR